MDPKDQLELVNRVNKSIANILTDPSLKDLFWQLAQLDPSFRVPSTRDPDYDLIRHDFYLDEAPLAERIAHIRWMLDATKESGEDVKLAMDRSSCQTRLNCLEELWNSLSKEDVACLAMSIGMDYVKTQVSHAEHSFRVGVNSAKSADHATNARRKPKPSSYEEMTKLVEALRKECVSEDEVNERGGKEYGCSPRLFHDWKKEYGLLKKK